jgi:hypothetical protein
MAEHRETYDAGSADELPAELKEPMIRLWRLEQPIVVSILPRDAWIALAIIQFAQRNPEISPMHREIIEAFGRELQRGFARIEPSLAKYLEMGWNPAFDEPKRKT